MGCSAHASARWYPAPGIQTRGAHTKEKDARCETRGNLGRGVCRAHRSPPGRQVRSCCWPRGSLAEGPFPPGTGTKQRVRELRERVMTFNGNKGNGCTAVEARSGGKEKVVVCVRFPSIRFSFPFSLWGKICEERCVCVCVFVPSFCPLPPPPFKLSFRRSFGFLRTCPLWWL